MKANLRYSINNDFLLDLEAENQTEIDFLKAVKLQGLMSVQLMRKDAETLMLPDHDSKIQFNISKQTLQDFAKILKKLNEAER
jgi:hypothetical protein